MTRPSIKSWHRLLCVGSRGRQARRRDFAAGFSKECESSGIERGLLRLQQEEHASSETGNSSAVCLPTRVVEAPRLEEGDDIASNADRSGAFAASGKLLVSEPLLFWTDSRLAIPSTIYFAVRCARAHDE